MSDSDFEDCTVWFRNDIFFQCLHIDFCHLSDRLLVPLPLSLKELSLPRLQCRPLMVTAVSMEPVCTVKGAVALRLCWINS